MRNKFEAEFENLKLWFNDPQIVHEEKFFVVVRVNKYRSKIGGDIPSYLVFVKETTNNEYVFCDCLKSKIDAIKLIKSGAL